MPAIDYKSLPNGDVAVIADAGQIVRNKAGKPQPVGLVREVKGKPCQLIRGQWYHDGAIIGTFKNGVAVVQDPDGYEHNESLHAGNIYARLRNQRVRIIPREISGPKAKARSN